jgi:hypothetical protein
MTNISTASGEEEAGPETALPKVSAGNRAGNRGLTRAGPAVQPEDALLVLYVSPVEYLPKEIDTGVMEASGLVLLCVRVKGRILSIR